MVRRITRSSWGNRDIGFRRYCRYALRLQLPRRQSVVRRNLVSIPHTHCGRCGLFCRPTRSKVVVQLCSSQCRALSVRRKSMAFIMDNRLEQGADCKPTALATPVRKAYEKPSLSLNPCLLRMWALPHSRRTTPVSPQSRSLGCTITVG